MEKLTIKLYNVEIEVHGYYYPLEFGDWETPPSPSQFEICGLLINNANVIDLLEDKTNEIENAVLEQIYDENN